MNLSNRVNSTSQIVSQLMDGKEQEVGFGIVCSSNTLMTCLTNVKCIQFKHAEQNVCFVKLTKMFVCVFKLVKPSFTTTVSTDLTG